MTCPSANDLGHDRTDCSRCKPDAKPITKGRIFNHRDGMSELKRFQMENDAKPMTAEDRTNSVCYEWCGADWGRSAESAAFYRMMYPVVLEAIQQAYAKGFSDALDKAAQKVQSFQWSDDNDSEVTEILAHKIRALERDK